jgi:PAS domain S-box-containing protein
MILNPILKIIRDLEAINEDRDFIRFRELRIRSVLITITIAAIFVLVLGVLLDHINKTPAGNALFLVRSGTALLLIFNLFFALYTPYLHKVKWLTFSSFYIWTLSATLISSLSGGFDSYLWGGIALVVIVWLSFVPFRYLRLILHAVLFLLIYVAGLWLIGGSLPAYPVLLGSGIYLIGALATGVVIAFVNNRGAAANYACSTALRISDNRYRILTENMQDVVWTLDLRRRQFTWISPSVEKLRGYTAEEVMRMRLEDSFTGESAEKVNKLLDKVAGDFRKGNDDISFSVGELEQTCRDGSTVWIEVAATLITDENGELVEMLGVSRNINARRKAEVALRESEEKYRNLVSQAKDGIFITQDGVFKYVNPAFCEITEYTAQELIGKNFSELIAPEEQEALTKLHKRRMAGENVPSIYTTIGISKSGRRVNLEFNSSTIEYEGRPASYVIMRDVSSQVEAARQLRESEEKYRSLIERANDGIVILQDGEVKFINQMMANILGYEVDEILNTPFVTYIAEHERRKIIDIYRRRQQGEAVPPIYESVLVQKDGTLKPVEFNNGIITYNGRIATQTYIRDITERKAAQQALIESEQRYALAVEGVNEGIFDWNLESGKVYFSNHYKAILGLEPDEMQNELSEWENRIHPDDRDRVLKANRDFIEGKVPVYNPEYRLLHSSGEYRWILARGVCLRHDNGKAYRMAGSHMDISDRRKAEELLRESEARYRSIFNTAGDAIFLIDKESGRIVDVNQSAVRIYGYSTEELLQLHIDQLASEPDDTIKILDRLNRFHFVPMRRSRRKDGQTVLVEISASYFEMEGKPFIIAIVHDITQRKRSEEELRRVNERLTLHFKETPLAYIEWNEKMEVTDWNPAAEKIFGYSKEEVLGEHAFNLIVPEHIMEEIQSLSKEILQQSGGQRSTNENLTKEGHTIICNWYNTPLKNESGNVIGLASLVQDITEQKKLEAELEKYVTVLEKSYSESRIKVQSYSLELETRKNELLRLQKENLQSQFETLRSQVNPHFLFNSLNVLTSLIKLEPDLAEQFTLRLSMVYRYVLENKDKDLVTLETELDFLKAYTFLLDIRFSGKMKVNVNLEDEKLQQRVVPLALQLLIENAIKHNTFSKKQPLLVDIFSEGDYLVVENNLQIREAYVQSTGVGLNNIASRYAFFTDRKMYSGEEDNKFVVRIPLL